MAAKFLNLLALIAIAVLACSFSASPSNALSIDSLHAVRHVSHHDAIAKRKRASGKRCKSRSSSSSPTHTSAKPKQTPSSNNGNNGNNGGSNGPALAGTGHYSTKTGIAWPNGDESFLQFFTPHARWLYTWGPQCPSNTYGAACVPMLWGYNQIGQFKGLVKSGYAHTVLGFNEPNEDGQSNISPQQGAQLWQTYIQPLKAQGYALISPATSSRPNGKTWMQSFFQSCSGCTFDGLAMHFYDVSVPKFQNYVTDFHNTFNLDMWITEYACENFNGGPQCSQQDTNSFHEQMKAFFDQSSFVVAYSPFGVMDDMQGVNTDNQLVSNGHPNALGSLYYG